MTVEQIPDRDWYAEQQTLIAELADAYRRQADTTNVLETSKAEVKICEQGMLGVVQDADCTRAQFMLALQLMLEASAGLALARGAAEAADSHVLDVQERWRGFTDELYGWLGLK